MRPVVDSAMSLKRGVRKTIGIIFPDEGAFPYELIDETFINGWLTDHGFGGLGYRIERTPGGKPLNLRDCEELARADHLLPAARRLAEAGADVAVWACVSASFHRGHDYAREQARGLAATAGVPATSVSLAMLEAVRYLRATRVDIMMNYMPEVAQGFVDFLAQADIDVVDVKHMTCRSDQRAFDLDYRSELVDFSRTLSPREHPVLIPSTSLSSLELVEDFEKIAGRPVITANQAAIWQAIRLLGIDARTYGSGAIFS